MAGGEARFIRTIHFVLAMFLFALGLFTGAKQYFGSPIECWVPEQFTGAHTEYANSYCYFSSTYYVPETELYVPDLRPGAVPAKRNLYKWTPFVLALIATVYILPCILNSLSAQILGDHFQKFILLARESNKGSKESREMATDQLVMEMEARLGSHVDRSRRSDLQRYLDMILPSVPMYIRFRDLISKLSYITSSALIVAFFYSFLEFNFNLYHRILLPEIAAKNESLFPKMILCDFQILRLGNMMQYTVQCHLPANELYEAIALLVCFLSIVMCSVSSAEFVGYLVRILIQPSSNHCLKRHMKLFAEMNSSYDKEMIKTFCERRLKEDGMYLIQVIRQNSSDLVVCRILEQLYANYKKKLQEDKSVIVQPRDGASEPFLKRYEATQDI